MSQDELAEKVFTSRQTISNWENNKTYPDINSIKLLSNIFDISIDDLLKEDIKIMKNKIKEEEKKGVVTISYIYGIELFIIIFSAYPLLKIVGGIGILVWIIFMCITLCTAFYIETLKKKYNIITYKEIIAFYDNKSLSHDEKIIEKIKRPYQKILLTLISGFIAALVLFIFELILG